MTERWYEPFKRALKSGAFVVSHFAVASFFVVTNYLIERLLHGVDDPRLYDVIPWRYVFDTIDIALVVVLAHWGFSRQYEYFEAIMTRREPWPTLGYLRHLFVIYAFVWGAAGGATLIAVSFWFSPFYTTIFTLVVALAVLPTAYKRWHAHRSISIAGE